MRDEQTTEQTLKIELLSQWKLEAEFRNVTSPAWNTSHVSLHPTTRELMSLASILGFIPLTINHCTGMQYILLMLKETLVHRDSTTLFHLLHQTNIHPLVNSYNKNHEHQVRIPQINIVHIKTSLVYEGCFYDYI